MNNIKNAFVIILFCAVATFTAYSVTQAYEAKSQVEQSIEQIKHNKAEYWKTNYINFN
ncbi:hypothetical protein HJ044_04995 [Vibrio parahaemolyticus]|nr:hypothetical protein [Vibrio parahaemolyticus]